MAQPSGAVAKLFHYKEATPGTLQTLTSTTGLRHYFDTFDVDAPNEPIDFEEVTGSQGFDHIDFPLGPPAIRARLAYACRYSGEQAVWDGYALGDLASSTPTPFTHTAQTADQYVAFSVFHQLPIGSNTVFSENRIAGTKVARARWSHRAGDILRCELDLVGMSLAYTLTESASVPPDGSGFNPSEALVEWHHLKSGATFQFDRSGAPAAVTLGVESWEITCDNSPEANPLIQVGRALGEPARGAKRTVRGRFTIEQDTPWEDVVDAAGLTISEALEAASLIFTYANPDVSNHEKTFQLSNVKIINRGGGTSGTGQQKQTFEFRAHYLTSGTLVNPEPLRILTKNTTYGPTGGLTTYGAYV